MKKNRQIGQRIKSFRENHYPNQKALADALGLGQSVVSAWERGDNVPSSEAWVKIGNLVSYPDCMWFWQQAGLSENMLLSAAEKILRVRSSPAKVGEIVRVPCVHQVGDETQEIESTDRVLALPLEFLPNPGSTQCMIIEPGVFNPMIFPGEGGMVVFDTYWNAAKGLDDFWHQVVLMDLGYEGGGQLDLANPGTSCFGLCVGRLVCEPDAHPHFNNPEIHSLSWRATLFPFFDNHRAQLEGILKKLTVGHMVHPSHGQRCKESEKWDLAQKVQIQAHGEMKLYPPCRILGRVIGWFRPPALKAKD